MSSRVQSGLTKQVDDVLTADTDWITLANELDVSRYTLRDAHHQREFVASVSANVSGVSVGNCRA